MTVRSWFSGVMTFTKLIITSIILIVVGIALIGIGFLTLPLCCVGSIGILMGILAIILGVVLISISYRISKQVALNESGAQQEIPKPQKRGEKGFQEDPRWKGKGSKAIDIEYEDVDD